MASYAKVTLTSGAGSSSSSSTSKNDEDLLSVDVYLPEGIKPDERVYYRASRFEHGSMIGSIRYKGHSLFGTNLWRMPHNSNWPESGVGLASEFGVGDEGDFCFYRCGWPLTGDITNGVLGYRQTKNGDSFLKIGVGELIKGSCPACDSTEDYKFNSPYLFAKEPQWALSQHSNQSLTLHHQAMLRNDGYKLQKDISLEGTVLLVTTKLTNIGTQPFSTVWYSHNFFHCDGVAVGPGYSIDMNLSGTVDPLYEEPGTWSWSTPLSQYAKVKTNNVKDHTVRVELTRALDPGIRIKTEFSKDGGSDGSFVLNACQTKIASSLISEDETPLEMYAYNLYMERGTVSPEPQILLHLAPGESRQWTQRLEFSPMETTSESGASVLLKHITAPYAPSSTTLSWVAPSVGVVALCFAVASVAHRWWLIHHKRRQYERISETSDSEIANL